MEEQQTYTPILLRGKSAIVADPCYHDSAGHMLREVGPLASQDDGTTANLNAGSWMMNAPREDLPNWGMRVAELTVIHTRWSSNHEIDDPVLAAGVDSGQMSICGKEDVASFQNRDWEPGDFDPDGNIGRFNYEGACEITLRRAERAGVLCGVMAVSESGCGDGVYPVFVWRNSNGEVTRITVDFLRGEDS